MKRSYKQAAMAAMILSLAACHQNGGKGAASGKVSLNTDDQKQSYAIGMDIGNSLKHVGMTVDMAALNAGISAELKGEKPLMTEKEAAKVRVGFFQKQQNKMMAKRKSVADQNLAAGKKLLAENAKKPGVKTTADGLEYKVIKEGTGPKPKATDNVTVNYEGKLLDGTVFDSSYQRGKPLTFPLNRVIKGWTEGLQLMSKGSKYMLYIPANLAYGEQGAGSRIGPNETLIFTVELLGINDKK